MWGQLLSRCRRGPTDVVGLDVEPTGIYAVRMSKGSGGPTVLGAGVLPVGGRTVDGSGHSPQPQAALTLPPKLRARYASLAGPGLGAVVKFMSFPGAFDEAMEAKAIQSLGLSDPALYRIGYKVIVHGHGKAETQLLVVAMREDEAQRLVAFLPSGLPALWSLEMADLAVLNAFQARTGARFSNETVGLIHAHMTSTVLAYFKEQTPVLVRRFEGGMESFLASLQRSLNVDRETAQSILTDASFDISQTASEMVEPLLKQTRLSRDFVERRENCRLQRMFISGGPFEVRSIIDEVRAVMGVEVHRWDMLEDWKGQTESLPADVTGRFSQFAAAIGACLGTLEAA